MRGRNEPPRADGQPKEFTGKDRLDRGNMRHGSQSLAGLPGRVAFARQTVPLLSFLDKASLPSLESMVVLLYNTLQWWRDGAGGGLAEWLAHLVDRGMTSHVRFLTLGTNGPRMSSKLISLLILPHRVQDSCCIFHAVSSIWMLWQHLHQDR